MIEVSEKYKELMNSNIRPKCEPVIKILNDDDTVAFEWRARNIKSLTFNRGIDPISRELPYMELTWTELYRGKPNEKGFADKYKGVSALMEVELSFEQTLGFFNTWQDVLNDYGTWQGVKDSGKTWGEIFKDRSVEVIKMPKMYLSAQPTLKNSTITWVARDILYFLNQEQLKEFIPFEPSEGVDSLNYYEILKWVLVDTRGNFIKNKKFFNALHSTVSNISEETDTFKATIREPILLNNTVKNNLLNLANIKLNYMNFAENRITFNSAFRFTESKDFILNRLTDGSYYGYTYSKKQTYGYPQVTPIANISDYEFKVYNRESGELSSEDQEYGNYIVTSANKSIKVKDIGNGILTSSDILSINTWNYRKIGKSSIELDSGNFYVSNTNKLVSNRQSNTPIFVYPFEYNPKTEVISGDGSGEQYTEDVPINGVSAVKNSAFTNKKINALKLYFNDSASNIEFTALPNLALEVGDNCYVETNLFTDENVRVIKPCLIIRTEISYSGALKVKTYAHGIE